ncbi:hypothetical protein RDWZM_006402 [Blomia tropicalis]|uniref:Protein kinase domain-containing protein n=1 Tax=Blomia tropicalis TaxID=40697 RepID=A0A9Q0M7L2_BLOTA|nr:hypothetical protein RDWZM_006402 [Blomia tropicalis]
MLRFFSNILNRLMGKSEMQQLKERIEQHLTPAGEEALELLNPDRVEILLSEEFLVGACPRDEVRIVFYRELNNGACALPTINLNTYRDHANAVKEYFNVIDIRKIASGGYGTIYQALDRGRPIKKFALKLIQSHIISRKYTKKWVGLCKTEIFFHINLRHSYILKTFSYMWLNHKPQDPFGSYLVMKCELLQVSIAELIEFMSLADPVVIKMFREIGSALCYMHGLKIVHHDIKPANIMIKTDMVLRMTSRIDMRTDLSNLDKYCFKLIDFGVTKRYIEFDRPMRDTYETMHYYGTPAYMSPEKREGLRFNPYLADSYAFGKTMFKSLAGFQKKDVFFKRAEGTIWMILESMMCEESVRLMIDEALINLEIRLLSKK